MAEKSINTPIQIEYANLVEEVYKRTSKGGGRVGHEVAIRSIEVALKFISYRMEVVTREMIDQLENLEVDPDIETFPALIEDKKKLERILDNYEIERDLRSFSKNAFAVSDALSEVSPKESAFWDLVGRAVLTSKVDLKN